MMFRNAIMTVGMAWALGLALQTGAGAQQKSSWDGVFTEEQAKRGEAMYVAECASCHQEDLAGDGFAPALTGAEFAAAWNGLPLADLLDRMRQSMPPSDPAAVTVAQKVDVIAFMLKANDFPAGSTELPQEAEALKQILYRATKQ